jgi:hypothetical protein
MEKPSQEEIDEDLQFCIRAQLLIAALSHFITQRDEDDGLACIARGLSLELDHLVDGVTPGGSNQTAAIDKIVDQAMDEFFRSATHKLQIETA